MPHSNFKNRLLYTGSGFKNCTCGQRTTYVNEREKSMKLRLHLKFCTNPPSVFPEDNKIIRRKMNENGFCELINKIYS